MITDPPWYISNETLHRDLNIPYVKEVVKEKSVKHHSKLENHLNISLMQAMIFNQQPQRLRRHWPEDFTED